jgi:hypothetical protein
MELMDEAATARDWRKKVTLSLILDTEDMDMIGED